MSNVIVSLTQQINVTIVVINFVNLNKYIMNTINFMYFAHNFNINQIDAIIIELGNINHFKSKFNNAVGTDATKKFFN